MRIGLILGLFLFSLFPTLSYAQEEETPVPAPIIFPTPTPAPSEYTLPYPGLLPTNPLYGLKVFRDNVIGFLITDPIKKAQFDILQADKRLAAGEMLLAERGHTETAITIISKSQNYLFFAVDKAQEAKKKGMDANDVIRHIIASGKKQEELLTDLTAAQKGGDQQKLIELAHHAHVIWQKADGFLPK